MSQLPETPAKEIGSVFEKSIFKKRYLKKYSYANETIFFNETLANTVEAG